MRILYGVSGEGFGHSSRAKIIISNLIKKGHEVLVLTYGQAVAVLKEFPLVEVNGISFVVKENKIDLPNTIIGSLNTLSSNIKNWPTIQKRVDEFNPQICITDFEPLVPIIRFWKNLPLISIDNQHRLTHLKLSIPKKYYPDFIIAKRVAESCVSRADAFIILSFSKGRPITKNAYVVEPILRKEVTSLKTKTKDYILVYLTKPNPSLIPLLKSINENFRVYGFDKVSKEENIEFKQIGPSFLKDLSDSKAVIATSGFSLMSESLYLKKPYFAFPMQGQFEQTLNAIYLKKAGFGDFSDILSKPKIEKFIINLPKYRKNLARHKTNPNEALYVLDNVLNALKPKF